MNKNAGVLLFVFIGVLLVLMAGSSLFNLYIDWLFFVETGFTGVFRTMLSAKVATGLVCAAFFLVFYVANIYIANRAEFPLRSLHLFGDTIYPVKTITIDKPVRMLTLAGGFVIALLVAAFGASKWEEVILFFNSIGTGMSEPVFGRDVSYYLFTLPLLDSVKGLAVLTIVLTASVTMASYFLRGGISISERSISLHPQIRRHVGFFCMLLFLILALHFYIAMYKLLFTQHGFLYGAAYTDINARLTTLRLLVFLSLISGALALPAVTKGSYKPLLYGAALTAVVYAGGFVVYAPFLQKFKVAPNELELEKPYIENNISFTRFGYDLNRIELKPFDVSYALNAADIAKNNATIKNIRLWDSNPLLRTYSQLQQIRTYYKFMDVDNDRYVINGEYRQVMLSPRELSYADLPSKSWINEHLVFTHGNGLALGPVSRITREGLPELIIKDIPPVSNADIHVTRPEIYYGEIPNDYVIANTRLQEFDYPTANENVYTRYKGSGGVALTSLLRRTLFAVKYNTAKIFLSSDITSESRILFNRNIRDRIAMLAPFLLFDSDPYMVITKDGRLVWMVDCYTMSRSLPYSSPINSSFNYIRNSVKAVVDAYNGSVAFYISDPDDILIKVYARSFPGLFQSLDAMPDDLKRHIRYPQGMLDVQARMFASYHMTDPMVFYNKEDLWEIPAYSDKPMAPYNTIMKLPGESREEYILLLPYTPSKRDNLAAWLAARCDIPDYGKLIAYVFPRDRQFFGPRQINARIDQDAYISQQITLWGQVGSQVIRGSLLIIPIENSLLYVQPLYLSAADRVGLPELRRVIVAFDKKVVMEENLELALQRLFGAGQPVRAIKPVARQPVGPSGNPAREARDVYEKALELQRQGDWAGYGEQIRKLGELLKQMAE